MKLSHRIELKLEKQFRKDNHGRDHHFYFADDIVINEDMIAEGVEITWTTEDQTEFEIWFPRERNPLSIFFLCKWFTLKSRNHKITKTIDRNIGCKHEVDYYFYSIYNKSTQTLAHGHSSPKMIIKK
ncbi:MAG: hypothetical protein EA359_10840 [Balneolaceae bacterium]|nr:MAG: hypothetical protein EA359_10840 [Balneolaceae bacterium]